jgi:O-antigen ligase
VSNQDRLTGALLLVFVLGLAFSITFSQILLALVVARWIWRLRDPAVRQRVRLPLLGPFLAFSALTLLSAGFSGDPWQALRQSDSLLLILVFFAFLNLVGGPQQAQRLLLAFAAAMTLVALYGLLQVAVCTAAGPVSPWIAWLLRVKQSACGVTFPFRAKGFYSIYMTLGGVLLMGLTMVAALSFSAIGRRRFLLSLGGVAQLGALIVTFSRNAWLGLTVGFVALSLVARRVRLVAVLGVAALLLFFAPAYMADRLTSLGDPRYDDSAKERLFMWSSGLRMVRDHPALGVGVGGVKRLYPSYVHPGAGKRSTGHLHSSPVQIAAERGLLGLAAWLWIWVAFFARGVKILRRLPGSPGSARMLTAGSLAAVLGFLVAGLFEYNFGDSEVAMVAYLMMAIPFVVERAEGEKGGTG